MKEKPGDYCSLVKNLSDEKRKRNGGVFVGQKRLRLKYKNIIFEDIASEEEDEMGE